MPHLHDGTSLPAQGLRAIPLGGVLAISAAKRAQQVCHRHACEKPLGERRPESREIAVEAAVWARARLMHCAMTVAALQPATEWVA
jgi:hypothetical protein